MRTKTFTYTYTKARLEVIEDHFELFLKCAGMSEKRIELMKKAVNNKELEAVGIYAEDSKNKVREVELRIDWVEHDKRIALSGSELDTNIPGWEDGLAPEAYRSVQKLVLQARNNNWNVRSWIRVTDEVNNNPDVHEKICKELGYSYHGKAMDWGEKPIEQERKINYLEEATVTQRMAPY